MIDCKLAFGTWLQPEVLHAEPASLLNNRFGHLRWRDNTDAMRSLWQG